MRCVDVHRLKPKEQQWKVVYLDECGIWQHAAKNWSWFGPGEDRTPFNSRASKGNRYNLIWAGTRDGWVKGTKWLKLGKKAGDFHGTISYGVFEQWVKEQLLPAIEGEHCIIVLDNAGFHNRVAVARSKMNKIMMQDYLTSHGVKFDDTMTKLQLLTLIDKEAPIKPQLEQLVREHGHRILWLPPYHPTLNPIEPLWGVIKNEMRRLHNDEPMTSDLFQERFDIAAAKVGPKQWLGSCEKSLECCYEFTFDDGINIDELDDGKRSADISSAPDYKQTMYTDIDFGSSSDDDDDDNDNDTNDDVEWMSHERKAVVGVGIGLIGTSSRGRNVRKPAKILSAPDQRKRLMSHYWGPITAKMDVSYFGKCS